MPDSFFFYDLETSGFSPKTARIMQFAGQRTNLSLKPIGEPVNLLIKLTPDVLPSPDAVLLTGITPQQTLLDGISEADFLKIFYSEIVKPGTTFVGFNSVRFDDEFMRYLNYRNFYDAYAWQWQDGNSRWDLIDVVRMTRALRPDGIKWPFASDGKPANRLEFLSSVNNLIHDSAHDALSDVTATIAVANLIKTKQPQLFNYLLGLRHKKQVAKLVNAKRPFVYTTGHFSSQFLHTSVVIKLADHPGPDAALVYDLRFDPTPFLKMTEAQLAESWRYSDDPEALHLPVKTLKYNRVPAIAPLGVINDEATQERIDLSLDSVNSNLKILKDNQTNFAAKVLKVVEQLDIKRARQQASLIDDPLTVDSRLYDDFFSKADARLMDQVRQAKPDQLSEIGDKFKDQRLKQLLPLYKARNFPTSLNQTEQQEWEEFTLKCLTGGPKPSSIEQYFARLDELSHDPLTKEQQYLVEELKLYGESILP